MTVRRVVVGAAVVLVWFVGPWRAHGRSNAAQGSSVEEGGGLVISPCNTLADLEYRGVGDSVKLTIERGDKELTVTLQLAARP